MTPRAALHAALAAIAQSEAGGYITAAEADALRRWLVALWVEREITERVERRLMKALA